MRRDERRHKRFRYERIEWVVFHQGDEIREQREIPYPFLGIRHQKESREFRKDTASTCLDYSVLTQSRQIMKPRD
jgi:hypothetical protein